MEKLVRERDFEGEPHRIRRAHPSELLRLIGRKLVEEAEEALAALMLHPSVISSADRKRRLLDELSDIIEATFSACMMNNIVPNELIAHAHRKAVQRGHIMDRVLIDATDDRAETKLRTLVEDLVAELRDARLVVTGQLDGTERLAALEQRARDLGCIGETA